MADKDILADAREEFDRVVEAETDNRNDYVDDIRFARLEEQRTAGPA
jgi:hypothetical protein